MCLEGGLIYNVKEPRTLLFLELDIVQQLLLPQLGGMIGEIAEDKKADSGFNLILAYNWKDKRIIAPFPTGNEPVLT